MPRAAKLTVAVVLACALCAGIAGCTQATEFEPTMSADDPAAKQACFANQRIGTMEAANWVNEGGRPMVGASVDGLVKVGALSQPVVCPAGGSFVFNPNDLSFTCSIHGWAPD